MKFNLSSWGGEKWGCLMRRDPWAALKGWAVQWWTGTGTGMPHGGDGAGTVVRVGGKEAVSVSGPWNTDGGIAGDGERPGCTAVLKCQAKKLSFILWEVEWLIEVVLVGRHLEWIRMISIQLGGHHRGPGRRPGKRKWRFLNSFSESGMTMSSKSGAGWASLLVRGSRIERADVW